MYILLQLGDGLAADVLVIHPEHQLADTGRKFTVRMRVGQAPALTNVKLYRTTTDGFVTWTKVADVQFSNGHAEFQTDRGGVYAAVYEKNLGLIVGISCLLVVLVLLLLGSVIYFLRHPGKWTELRSKVTNVKRSTQSRI